MITRPQFRHPQAALTATLAVALATCACSSATQPNRGTAADFAHSVASGAVELLAASAAINPKTGREETARRTALLKRQRELDNWLDQHDRYITLNDCKTPQDRRNYREFKSVMPGYRFLRMPSDERRDRLTILTRYFREFETHFAHAYTRTLRLSTPHNLPKPLADMLASPPDIDTTFFGRDPTSMIASVYVPADTIMYLNVDFLAESPEDFVDAFEHELWHHLVPSVGSDLKLHNNLWIEGFNETLSETWAWHFQRIASPPPELTSSSVEYPVQCAFASLYLDAAPAPSLRLLCNELGTAQFDHEVRAGSPHTDAPPANWHAMRADAWKQGQHMTPAHQARVETMLTDWGWKEDNGDPVSVAYILTAARRLDHTIIDREFRGNRRFLMDVVQAHTVVLLQDLCKTAGGKRRVLRRARDLAAPLQHNLERVLDYIEDPYYQLSLR